MVNGNGPYIRVVCALIEREQAGPGHAPPLLLAARRKPEQTNGGLWEFPGGKVHAGEELREALHREIREELDIPITIHRDLHPVRWRYPWIAIELFPFICSVAAGCRPVPFEHAEVGFFRFPELTALEWAPADRRIVDRYFSGAGAGP